MWFVATDVCSALGIKNPAMALSRLDEDEKNTISLNEGIVGNPNKGVVNEYGLYRLAIGSRKKKPNGSKDGLFTMFFRLSVKMVHTSLQLRFRRLF